MENKVFAINCEGYNQEMTYEKLKELLLKNNLLDFVKKDMVIAIKANLVAAMKPDSAATTHPSLLISLCKVLLELGAKVIVGDSPGGLYQEVFLNSIYKKTQVDKVLEIGASLNHDFQQEIIDTPELKIVKHLDCCSWLLKADAIINFCKMKTHGMMSLSAATKNMFGSVPGTIKLEYHYRYPRHEDFANMLIDIQQFYKCKLHICDAILAMEGNGPTMGKPKHVGLLLASKSCYALDIVCCKLMNLDINNVPTITQAIERNLSVKSFEEIQLNMDIEGFIHKDFENIQHSDNILFFSDKHKNIFKRAIGVIAKKILIVRPKAKKKECIGCRKCADICPAKAITITPPNKRIYSAAPWPLLSLEIASMLDLTSSFILSIRLMPFSFSYFSKIMISPHFVK